jgi:hypothetical protein
MLIDFLKNIMYVFVICVFLYLILGQYTVEGMEDTDVSTKEDAEAEDTKNPDYSEPLTKVSSSDVSELLDRVNTQTDIIRTFKGSFDPVPPLKIDGTGDERIVLLKNIKLLLNNGIFKNETDLREYEYFGNKAVNTLVSEVNNLNMENPASITDINKKEIDYVNRSRSIVWEHQKIIDLELKRRAK